MLHLASATTGHGACVSGEPWDRGGGAAAGVREHGSAAEGCLGWTALLVASQKGHRKVVEMRQGQGREHPSRPRVGDALA